MLSFVPHPQPKINVSTASKLGNEVVWTGRQVLKNIHFYWYFYLAATTLKLGVRTQGVLTVFFFRNYLCVSMEIAAAY